MWRLTSFTYIFILIMIGVAIVAPFDLSDNERGIILKCVLPFILMREKTNWNHKRKKP